MKLSSATFPTAINQSGGPTRAQNLQQTALLTFGINYLISHFNRVDYHDD